MYLFNNESCLSWLAAQGAKLIFCNIVVKKEGVAFINMKRGIVVKRSPSTRRPWSLSSQGATKREDTKENRSRLLLLRRGLRGLLRRRRRRRPRCRCRRGLCRRRRRRPLRRRRRCRRR